MYNSPFFKRMGEFKHSDAPDAKGEPTRYAMALKKWGFGSREAARNFCNNNKEK